MTVDSICQHGLLNDWVSDQKLKQSIVVNVFSKIWGSNRFNGIRRIAIEKKCVEPA